MICSIEDCDRPVKGRGWCGVHYGRWLRHGDTHACRTPDRDATAVERIPFYVDATGDCWLWTGYVDPEGYGHLRYRDQRWAAHRWVWTNLIGPIADGLTIDHLCRVTRCVNPDHLEVVPFGVNTLRGYGMPARNARKTHCKRGHAFDEDNTYASSKGGRICRACVRLHRQGVLS